MAPACPFRLGFEDLPTTLPIFPLPGVLLLPRGRLPLNIFEPRYLNMTVDALAARDRLIGMIQPLDPKAAGAAPPLYGIGCAGRITAFSETEDGRYLITLSGVCRFRVAEEIPTTRGYRRVRPDFAPFRADLADEGSSCFDRERLLGVLKAYFATHGIGADWEAIRAAADDCLVTTLAMLCPFAPTEKQALLECSDLGERSAFLHALLEMALAAPSGDAARH